jgi:hypothetical protein
MNNKKPHAHEERERGRQPRFIKAGVKIMRCMIFLVKLILYFSSRKWIRNNIIIPPKQPH